MSKRSFRLTLLLPNPAVTLRTARGQWLDNYITRRRNPVSFTTGNMATATKIIQRLRNFLSGVSHKIKGKFVMIGLCR